MSSNVSFGGCGSVCAHAQLSPFYLLSTPRRQSRDKLYQAFRSLNFLRVKGRQRERMAWERGYCLPLIRCTVHRPLHNNYVTEV